MSRGTQSLLTRVVPSMSAVSVIECAPRVSIATRGEPSNGRFASRFETTSNGRSWPAAEHEGAFFWRGSNADAVAGNLGSEQLRLQFAKVEYSSQ